MNKLILMCAAATLSLGMAMGVPAYGQSETKAKVTVVEKNAQGKATKVEIDGKVWNVCMSDADDNCVNPREAGLNFGNWPMKEWPGQPASSM